MKNHSFGLFALILAALFPGPAPAGEELPRGKAIAGVVCVNNPSQQYALYLPSGYSPARKWPILYALDPGARGLIPVERFKEAAETYGYILAGSNNSQNGPVKIVETAMRAILADTRTRFSIDPQRTYIAGFSGGARAAVQVALAPQVSLAGVILCGAGYPPDLRPALPIPFSLFLAAGIDDFNFPELRELDRQLERLQVTHEFEAFSGKHEWPPVPVCSHAIEWLELAAMRSGIRPRDSALIDAIYEKRMEQLGLCEIQKNRTGLAEGCSAALRAFQGLRDVSELETKTKLLNPAAEIRKARSIEKEMEKRQRTGEREVAALLDSFIGGDDRLVAKQRLAAAFERLRARSEQRKDDLERTVAARLLSDFWILLDDQVSLAFDRRDYAVAADQLEIMAQIRPDNPQVYYHIARANCLRGRKKDALDALRTAVAKGYRDFATLEANREMDPLRRNPEFARIIEALKKD